MSALPLTLRRVLFTKGVRKPTGLSTRSPVSASPADGIAHMTLPGVCDADGSMDKNFDFSLASPANMPYFSDRKFPGQDDTLKSRTICLLSSCGIVYRPLRAEMKYSVRHPPHQFCRQPAILKNKRIRAIFLTPLRESDGVLEFFFSDEGIQRDMHAYAVFVSKVNRLLKGVLCKVVRIYPGIKRRSAQINGVCSVRYGSSELLIPSGRYQQFRYSFPFCFIHDVLHTTGFAGIYPALVIEQNMIDKISIKKRSSMPRRKNYLSSVFLIFFGFSFRSFSGLIK